MANATVNLSLVKSGYVQSAYPATVFPTNGSSSYYCSSVNYNVHNYLYLGFAALANSLKNRRIYSARLYLQVHDGILYATPCDADFNPSTLCYDNRPGLYDTG